MNRLLPVGFDGPTLDALGALGWHIPAAVLAGRVRPKGEPAAELIAVEDLYGHRLGRFAGDLDPGIAAKVRADAGELFLRTHIRHFSRRYRPLPTWLDVANHFELALQRFWILLREHQIDCVLFANVPHQGAAIILYYLAKALRLKVLVCLQSSVPGAFWAADSIEGIGAPRLLADAGFTIPIETDPASPFYMRSAKPIPRWRRHLRKAGAKADLAAKWAIGMPLWHRKVIHKRQVRLASERARQRHQRRLARLTELPRTGEPFIYVPLHLQPEMTTDSLGGVFCDQLLMLERLAAALPPDHWLYVKENPKQTTMMREESFFARLAALPRVRLMATTEPSLGLIRASRAVATVTGTAGWEAVQLGRPALLFGTAWYKGLPGVFAAGLDTQAAVAAALSWRSEPQALAAAVTLRARSLFRGVTDLYYAQVVPDFDAARNSQHVAESLDLGLGQLTESDQ